MSTRNAASALALSVALTMAATAARGQAPEPLCGIYAVYAAAKVAGTGVQISALLRPEFVSEGAYGSTMGDLLAALRTAGLRGTALRGMTLPDLDLVGRPVILHVRSFTDAPIPDHYLLYLGRDTHNPRLARVVDGERGIRLIDSSLIARRWTGDGIVVSRADDTRPVIPWGAVLVLLTVVAAATGARLSLQWWGGTLADRPLAGGAILVGVSLTIAAAFHARAESGLIRNPDAAIEVEQIKSGSLLQREDLGLLWDKVASGAVTRGQLVIVDGRTRAEFDQGHLPGAVSLPLPDARAMGTRRLLPDTPRDRRVVVYCSDRACNVSKVLAKRLLASGFKNVSVLEEGWTGWQQHQAKASSRPGSSAITTDPPAQAPTGTAPVSGR